MQPSKTRSQPYPRAMCLRLPSVADFFQQRILAVIGGPGDYDSVFTVKTGEPDPEKLSQPSCSHTARTKTGQRECPDS